MTGTSPNLATPTVRPVTAEEVAQLRQTHGKWTPNLGGHHSADAAFLEMIVGAAQDEMKTGAETYLVEWQGSKIPRGASIHGIAIGWTQNGIVSGTQGENLGTYERLVEFGGESGREHKMLVFAPKSGT